MVFSKVKGQTTGLAKRVVRQIVAEPFEVLKKAPEQIAGMEKAPQEILTAPEKQATITPEEKAKIEAQGNRQLKALEAEIKDIQKLQKQKEAARAQEGQSPEPQELAQKRMLKEPPTKRSRRLFHFGKKAQAEKQKTRIEKPLPPSG
jgi:hypothetical protein